MSDIVNLPTKFGQGHADSIAFFRDVVLPALIQNKVKTLVVRGVTDDGTELNFTMIDMGEKTKRASNIALLGLIAEMQTELAIETLS